MELKADGSLHTGIGTTSVFRTLDFNGRLIKDTFNGFSRTWTCFSRTLDLYRFCPDGGVSGRIIGFVSFSIEPWSKKRKLIDTGFLGISLDIGYNWFLFGYWID